MTDAEHRELQALRIFQRTVTKAVTDHTNHETWAALDGRAHAFYAKVRAACIEAPDPQPMEQRQCLK